MRDGEVEKEAWRRESRGEIEGEERKGGGKLPEYLFRYS